MKRMCLSAAALCMAALCFFGCASTDGAAKAAAEAAAVQPVTAAVKSISKYGNCSLELTPEALADAGYEAGDLLTVTVGSAVINLPYGTSYSDVEHGSPLVLNYKGDIQVAINMGNFAKTYTVAEGDQVTVSMAKKAGYLKEYKIRQLKKSENREDYASDVIFANFRAVKAGKIAANRLYRGCNPLAGDVRGPYSDKLAQEAGIKVAVNLADSAEEAAAYLEQAPYYASLVQQGNVVFLNMGVSFTDPDFVAKLHDGLVFMTEHAEGPYMVHCKEGKDRAGFVNALLEALCGATLEEMTEDYMLSFENYFGVQKGSEQYALIGQTIPDMFKTMNGENMVTNKNVKAVAEKYALETVGLTKEQLTALVTLLTK